MQTLKEARQFAYDLILDGKTQYHMLDDYEKSVLTGHIINATDKLHIWEYITEADFNNELPSILSEWLCAKNNELSELMGNLILNKLRNNAVNYASKEAMRILEEQEQEWEFDKKFNHE